MKCFTFSSIREAISYRGLCGDEKSSMDKVRRPLSKQPQPQTNISNGGGSGEAGTPAGPSRKPICGIASMSGTILEISCQIQSAQGAFIGTNRTFIAKDLGLPLRRPVSGRRFCFTTTTQMCSRILCRFWVIRQRANMWMGRRFTCTGARRAC